MSCPRAPTLKPQLSRSEYNSKYGIAQNAVPIQQYRCRRADLKCSETFWDKNNRNAHESTHIAQCGEARYCCGTCELRFPSLAAVGDHLRGAHGYDALQICETLGDMAILAAEDNWQGLVTAAGGDKKVAAAMAAQSGQPASTVTSPSGGSGTQLRFKQYIGSQRAFRDQ